MVSKAIKVLIAISVTFENFDLVIATFGKVVSKRNGKGI